MESSLKIWRSRRSLPNALDLLTSASHLDGAGELQQAAEFVIDHGDASMAAKALAIGRYAGRRELAEAFFDSRTAIREARARLGRDPRNAFAALNLAHAFCAIGKKDAARRAVDWALAVGGGNRTILRGAARFLLHIDERELAHRLLARAPSLHHDPWLLAGELALAEVLGRTSKHVRSARDLAASEMLSPFHRSELQAALGDMQVRRGDHKLAKKSYLAALRDPTENVVAQAQFLATTGNVSSLPVGQAMDALLEAPEARGFDALARGNWDEACRQARRWLQDEPFSTRPVNLGFTAAEVGSEDMNAAFEFAEKGYQANPGNPMQHNNFAFTLAHLGVLDRAELVFDACRGAILRQEGEARDRAVYRATEGLLAFRRGQIEAGRQGYRDAVTYFERHGERIRHSIALARWANEEARVGYFAEAVRLFAQSLETGRTDERTMLTLLLENIRRAIDRQKARSAGAAKSPDAMVVGIQG
ncbi:MAG TPA: hypothetical protein VE866_09790 [Candidatus Binatia bacterium]|nr:hypothetical protein [Candidatus Binatia bacterium]